MPNEKADKPVHKLGKMDGSESSLGSDLLLFSQGRVALQTPGH